MRFAAVFATLALVFGASTISATSNAKSLDGLTSGPVNVEIKKHGADDKAGDDRGGRRGGHGEDECIVDDRC